MSNLSRNPYRDLIPPGDSTKKIPSAVPQKRKASNEEPSPASSVNSPHSGLKSPIWNQKSPQNNLPDNHPAMRKFTAEEQAMMRGGAKRREEMTEVEKLEDTIKKKDNTLRIFKESCEDLARMLKEASDGRDQNAKEIKRLEKEVKRLGRELKVASDGITNDAKEIKVLQEHLRLKKDLADVVRPLNDLIEKLQRERAEAIRSGAWRVDAAGN